jgi:hypothetical protein
MKHQFSDPLDIRVHHDHNFDKQDIEKIIDKITESAIVIIAASTVAHILKKVV